MKKTVLAAAGGLLYIHSGAIFAQSLCTAGQLDLNFGSAHTGYVQTSPTLYNYPNALPAESEVLDSSGASYSVSTAAADSVGYGVPDIVKVKHGGVRDLAFGGFGSVVPPPPATESADAALAMDSAGNLVIATMSADSASVVLYRYSAAGTLDTTYGTSGIATIPVARVTGPWAIKALADGSVLVAAGAASDPSQRYQPAVFKITPAGALDTAFGVAGFSYFYSGAFGPTGKATDLSVESNGSILVGGRVGDNSTYDQFFVARLFANGALDTSFGTNAGMTVVSFGNDVLAYGRKMAVQSDGRIVLMGGFGADDTGVIRLRADGVLDTTFNSTGTLHLTGFHGWQVALQNNDKILIAATQATGPQTTNALVVRLTASGQLDPAFGPNHDGKVTLAVPSGASAFVSAVSYQPHTGIHVLVTGTDVTSTISTEYLARLEAGVGPGCH